MPMFASVDPICTSLQVVSLKTCSLYYSDITRVEVVPEAIAEGTNGQVVISELQQFRPKHILMTRGITEGHSL